MTFSPPLPALRGRVPPWAGPLIVVSALAGLYLSTLAWDTHLDPLMYASNIEAGILRRRHGP